MEIDIYAAPVCPWCFIGKKRLERALTVRTDIKAEIKWRAFQLNPTMPLGGMPRDEYLITKFGSLKPQIFETIYKVGIKEGIEFAFDNISCTPNTIDAHRLIHYATRFGVANSVVDALFQDYFFNGRDIGDLDVLTSAAIYAGLDRSAAAAHLAGVDDTSEVKAEDHNARKLGIQGVPCFIVENRYVISGAQEPEAFYPLFDIVQEMLRKP